MAQEFVASKACLEVSFKRRSLRGKRSRGSLWELSHQTLRIRRYTEHGDMRNAQRYDGKGEVAQ